MGNSGGKNKWKGGVEEQGVGGGDMADDEEAASGVVGRVAARRR
jgi:hypothetical protein